MGFYAEPARPAWNPVYTVHGLWDPIQTYTPCLGSDTKHTRPAWDPIQILHGLCGILYRAYTPSMGSDKSLHGLS
eukprot:6602614-Pyramimonas_sp.AAC.1